jgi:3',5'-cyclic-AMP phosphodiesterase
MSKTNTRKISRREFVAASVLGGVALTVAGSAPAAAMQDKQDTWILLADTHIPGDRTREARGIKPVETLSRARSEILALKSRPKGVLIAGDCAYDTGQADDYAVLKEGLAPFSEAEIPVHMAMGNHDNRERFWAAFPESKPRSAKSGLEKHAAVVEGRHADWFVLDSMIETRIVHGAMGKPQLEWLAAELDKEPDKPALLIAHHYPSASEGDNGLRDLDALWSVIQSRKRVKAYLFGHSHSWRVQERDGIHLINLAALAWLFDEEGQPRAWVEAAMVPDKMHLQLHCMNGVHPSDGDLHTFAWRA